MLHVELRPDDREDLALLNIHYAYELGILQNEVWERLKIVVGMLDHRELSGCSRRVLHVFLCFSLREIHFVEPGPASSSQQDSVRGELDSGSDPHVIEGEGAQGLVTRIARLECQSELVVVDMGITSSLDNMKTSISAHQELILSVFTHEWLKAEDIVNASQFNLDRDPDLI